MLARWLARFQAARLRRLREQFAATYAAYEAAAREAFPDPAALDAHLAALAARWPKTAAGMRGLLAEPAAVAVLRDLTAGDEAVREALARLAPLVGLSPRAAPTIILTDLTELVADATPRR